MSGEDKQAIWEQGDVNLTPARQQYWEGNLSDQAREWFARDKQYFLHQALSTPVMNVLSRASGAWIQDLDGKWYLDMHGNGVHNAGFNHPLVLDAVRRQLDEGLTFCPRRYTNIPAVRLAEKLSTVAPGDLRRVLFCPGGSEAVEMALMLARMVTGRFKTISFWDAYHGTGFGAASVSGEEHFHGRVGPLVPGAFHVQFPDYYRNPWGFTRKEDVDAECLRQIEQVLQREPEMAAIIAEPVSAKPVVPTREFWTAVRTLCDAYGALLIFDEIIEGLGRTGRMFACEHFVQPDVLVLGKSLGGGLLPFAGIVTREAYNVLQDRSIGHYTHEKNALCASAGLAGLEVIETQGLPGRAAEQGRYFFQALEDLRDKHPLIGNVTGLGLHLGIELVRDRTTREKAVQEAEAVMFKALEQGLSFKVIDGNVLTLRPALTISREEIDLAVDILDRALEAVKSVVGKQ